MRVKAAALAIQSLDGFGLDMGAGLMHIRDPGLLGTQHGAWNWSLRCAKVRST